MKNFSFLKSSYSKEIIALLTVGLILVFIFDVKLLRINKALKRQRTNLSEAFVINQDRQMSLLELTIEDINLKDLLISDYEGKTKQFSENSFPLLVFRIPKENCIVCVDSIIQQLDSFQNKFSFEKYLLIGSFNSLRELMVFSKNRKNADKIFMFNTMELSSFPIETSQIPYFFIISRDHRVTNVYIPNKGFPEGTERYLKLVFDKYFTDKGNDNTTTK